MKKLLLCSLIVLLCSTIQAGTKPHCLPAIYDAIYLRLVKERLELNVQKLIIINREGVIIDHTHTNVLEPDLFDLFRKLCYGQKSIYETIEKDVS